MKTEGYWNNALNWYPEYPMPVHSDEELENKTLILLRLLEATLEAEDFAYRGWSSCRCCGLRTNGSHTYELNGWRWPQGFKHYIEVHNVKPSDAFMKEVLGL